jgi:hypothetical protein
MNKKKWFAIIGCVILILVFLVVIGFVNSANKKATLTLSETLVPLNSDFSELRIENEAKLVVPDDKIEEVWGYLVGRLVDDKTFIQSIDPSLDSYWYDELFVDVYYDSPDLVMLNHQSGIRYRTRTNLTNPEAEKSGRQLMQIKINDVSDNALSRGELKFDIRDDGKTDDTDDLHPVLGLVQDSERKGFMDAVSEFGIDPYDLQKVLKLEQRRRSIYITRNGDALMSVRFDEVTSELLWVTFSHCEIEIEINEIPYTEGSDEDRAYMENVQQQIMKDVLQQYPDVALDVTPKYNKAFNYFESEIPYLRTLIRWGLIQ